MMNDFKIGAPMRFFMIVIAAILIAGIWLTGYKTVHWLLYIPVIFFVFAAVTGICPGMFFSRKLFGKKAG
ncbi:MAG: hypothetical protein PVG75_10090 [Thioalkalispiraceae bacterium]|jgi:hypothetical protein